MARRRYKNLPPKPGWAIYLRTSDKDAQNPENSQNRQRHAIERSLLERSDQSVIGEYIDNLSGRYADNRPGYQRMLDDARTGKFSHVAVENAERFGRNDTEALVAIDELHELGIGVRFADYPDLDPIDPDDRILVSLSFTLARRESIKLGQRVRGGHHAKLRSGGFVGKPPDGYLNAEKRTDVDVKTQHGKYTRWIEQDPERIHIWRFAWDLLLEDRLTLEEICEELHARGYRYRSGRPFVQIKSNGKRKANKNTLSSIFHNWFYAGWVVSEKANIAPKQVRGQWQELVTTEEFERGLEILDRRNKHRVVKRKHSYLLRTIIYVEMPGTGELVRLSGSTSNTGRSGGGTAYYCVPSSNINILCSVVDDQIPECLQGIQVDPELVPIIRESYTEEIARKLGHNRPDEREALEDALKSVDAEEARMARLYATGKISEKVWDNLWAEWQDKRRQIYINLEGLAQKREYHIANLDAALTIISKVGILYNNLERSDQRELLRQMIERVVVNPEGMILRLDLLSPFSYLRHVTRRIEESKIADAGNTKTSAMAGQCSELVFLGDREFYDARRNLLSLQSTDQWIVHLSYLIHSSDPTVRRNAIHLLGDVADIVALPALLSLIQNDSPTIRQDTLTAISTVIDEAHLPRLFEWLPEDFADFTNLAEIFFQLKREVSGYIVQTLDNTESAFNRQVGLALIQMSENDVVNVMGHCVKNQIDLGDAQIEPVEGEHAMKLHELLQKRFNKMQDTTTFNRLVDDVSNVLTRNSTRPQDTPREPDPEDEGAQALKRRRRKTVKAQSASTEIPDRLRQAFEHDEWLIRYKALQELASYPPKAVMPLLMKASQDSDAQVQVAALDILANFSQSAEIRKIFISALQDGEHLVIDTATDHIKDFETVDTQLLLPLLKDENVQTVAAVIEILTEKNDATAVPSLISLLDDERKPWLSDKTLGHFAAKALIAIGTPDALNAIKKSGFVDAPDLGSVIPPAIEHQYMVEHQRSDAVAKQTDETRIDSAERAEPKAIKGQKKTYTVEEKIRLTLIALRGDRWELSQKAARYMRDLAKSLEGTDNLKVIQPLEDALTDDIWTVRWVAVEALAWIKSTSSIPKMLPLLGDSNWMIQVATIRALAELKAVDTAPKIAILLRNPNSSVSEAAAEALGILKNSDSLTALRETLKSPDEFVRLSAIKSIYQIQGANSVPYLISALNDSYNHVRWFAIKHLSRYATMRELPAIVTLLPDDSGPIWENKTISDYALEALEQINTPESLAVIEEWAEQSGLNGDEHEDIY